MLNRKYKLIHRPEEALDIQSDLRFVSAMMHYPRNEIFVYQQVWERGVNSLNVISIYIHT